MSVDTRNNEKMCKRYRMTARTAPAGRVLIGLCAMTGLLSGSLAAQATPVTVNLGQSAEQFVEHGLGPDMSTGRGTYAFDQGNCLFDGTNTTCTLSGAFSGTTSGFTAGTYTFVTEYSGTGLSPIRGISTVGDPNLFNYLFPLPSSASMTLNLVTTGGHFVEPLVTGGFSTPTVLELNFTYVTYACSGVTVATCTPGTVGLTNGAIGQGPVTTVVTFDNPVPTTTTTPSSTSTTTTLACDPQTLARAQIDAQCNCGGAANHGAYVKCVAQHVNAAVKMGTLPKSSAHPIKMCAARSTCGKPGFVTCCRTTAKGVTKCSIKHGAGKCKVKHGTATVGSHASCCDACSATSCILPTSVHVDGDRE
jgi:hypothetical protein